MMYKRIMTLAMIGFMAGLHASGQEWKIMTWYVKKALDFGLHEMCEEKKACIELEDSYLKKGYNCKDLSEYLKATGQEDRIPQVIKTDEDRIASIEEFNQLIISQMTEYSKLKSELHSVNNNSSLHEICEKIVKSNSEMELIEEAEMKMLKLMSDNMSMVKVCCVCSLKKRARRSHKKL